MRRRYQSFFPPDVRYVADHARRSISRYPLADGVYYGIDYRKRGEAGVPLSEIPCNFVPPHCVPASQTNGEHACDGLQYRPNDLSWYANIPTPCSYMCVGSNEDFFGGYDHFAKAGLIHVANHHISPGKKQWTEVVDQIRLRAAVDLFEKLAEKEMAKAQIEYTGKSPYYKPGTNEIVMPNSGG